MNAENEPSWRTAMKNGMTQTDEYTDAHHGRLKVFCIDRNTWEKQCTDEYAADTE